MHFPTSSGKAEVESTLYLTPWAAKNITTVVLVLWGEMTLYCCPHLRFPNFLVKLDILSYAYW